MKKIFAVAFALIAVVGANALYLNAKRTNTEVVHVTTDITVPVAWNDDGHWHYCGFNKCPYF